MSNAKTKWSIRNHLGGEVGYVETDLSMCDPIVAYAVKVQVSSSVLNYLGYKAVRLTDTTTAGEVKR